MSTEQDTTHEESGTFIPLTHTKNTMEEISIDVIGPLPRSEDKDAILVVVD